MKKPLTLLAIASMFTLAGCTETAIEEPKEEVVEVSTTEKAETDEKAKVEADAKAKEEASKKAEADKKAKAEEKATAEAEAKVKAEEEKAAANKVYADEIGEYSAGLGTIFGSFTQHINDFTNQTALVSENPFLTLDSDWLTDTAIALFGIQSDIDAINSTNPPKGFEEIHALNQQIATEWQFVVDNFPQAIDNMDTQLIQECATHIELGTQYTQESTKLIDAKLLELEKAGIF